MSALDIGARGLAVRAREAIARSDEGTVSISTREAETAFALETLAEANSAIAGEAGKTHIVETTPFINRERLVIRGNGAELYNVNQTPLPVDHHVSAALALGNSAVWQTNALDYYDVLTAAGTVLTVAPGDGDNFSPGDLVIMHGATKYEVPSAWITVFRNYLRARVLEATSDSITLDRAPAAELLADDPVIGNVAQQLPSTFPAGDVFYLLYAPHISNLRITSDVGDAMVWGGVIDGTIRDIEVDGRNGMVFNAMQDCLIENIHFRAWRKICELAEGSRGTTVRFMRGTLSDSSTRYDGESDAPPFFIAIAENSVGCSFENLDVSSGVNQTAGNGPAVLLASGCGNEIRNSTLRFPAHVSQTLAIQSNSTPGNSNIHCGFRNLEVHAPVCSQFLACNDSGAGIERPYLIGSRFYGTPSLRAAILRGTEGLLSDNWFEHGDVEFDPAATDWRVEGNTIHGALALAGSSGNVVRENFLRDGFAGLTDAELRTNHLADNESDASRRLNAAAVILSGQTKVTDTAANSIFASAVFAASDLTAGDKVFFSSLAITSYSGTSNRYARLSVTQNGSTTGLGSRVMSNTGTRMGFDGALHILSDTFVVCDFAIGSEHIQNTLAVPSISQNGLQVNLEYWVSNTAEHINVRGARIIPVKPGMRHLPIK